MPKKHIHPYQTRYHAKAIYSKAIRASGDMVFMQGQVGVDDNGDLVGKGDPGKQADQAGGELTDVCKLTVYVTDISYRPAVYQAINKWFDGVRHCSTGVVVSSLADEDLLVEIDAIGMID
ncbi:MAG: RidA family protein [Paracoccaceae bacterium]|nr:RidA family protein [Paracoccaceae bacterium]